MNKKVCAECNKRFKKHEVVIVSVPPNYEKSITGAEDKTYHLDCFPAEKRDTTK